MWKEERRGISGREGIGAGSLGLLADPFPYRLVLWGFVVVSIFRGSRGKDKVASRLAGDGGAVEHQRPRAGTSKSEHVTAALGREGVELLPNSKEIVPEKMRRR